jgi:hypothetical protein
VTECDIVLDTFVYGAHTTGEHNHHTHHIHDHHDHISSFILIITLTTTIIMITTTTIIIIIIASDVLWVGVPLFSLRSFGSDRMPSRVAASISASLDYEVMISPSDDYRCVGKGNDSFSCDPYHHYHRNHHHHQYYKLKISDLLVFDTIRDYEDSVVRILQQHFRFVLHYLKTYIQERTMIAPTFDSILMQLSIEQSYQSAFEVKSIISASPSSSSSSSSSLSATSISSSINPFNLSSLPHIIIPHYNNINKTNFAYQSKNTWVYKIGQGFFTCCGQDSLVFDHLLSHYISGNVSSVYDDIWWVSELKKCDEYLHTKSSSSQSASSSPLSFQIESNRCENKEDFISLLNRLVIFDASVKSITALMLYIKNDGDAGDGDDRDGNDVAKDMMTVVESIGTDVSSDVCDDSEGNPAIGVGMMTHNHSQNELVKQYHNDYLYSDNHDSDYHISSSNFCNALTKEAMIQMLNNIVTKSIHKDNVREGNDDSDGSNDDDSDEHILLKRIRYCYIDHNITSTINIIDSIIELQHYYHHNNHHSHEVALFSYIYSLLFNMTTTTTTTKSHDSYDDRNVDPNDGSNSRCSQLRGFISSTQYISHNWLNVNHSCVSSLVIHHLLPSYHIISDRNQHNHDHHQFHNITIPLSSINHPFITINYTNLLERISQLLTTHSISLMSLQLFHESIQSLLHSYHLSPTDQQLMNIGNTLRDRVQDE